MIRIRSLSLCVAIVCGVLWGCAVAPPPGGFEKAAPASAPFRDPPPGKRLLVFVSDFHMGVGRSPRGGWDATEDFRWHGALEGFLEEISRTGEGRTDLVIVGDFLELWQPPPDIPCRGPGTGLGSTEPDLGCSVAETARLAALVVSQHARALTALRAFSQRDENRLRLIPGNHDAAILLAPVWNSVSEALEVTSGRVELVTSGVWVSRDGQVVAEHGHQIGADVNSFEDWPAVTRVRGGTEYVIRPWGERFVQEIFNAEEAQYPIIDNLSPEAAGARYRMQDRGAWRSAADMARFIRFNLFETSIAQKVAVLGKESRPSDRQVWNVAIGRKMGHRLFADALEPEDPFRKTLLEDHPESKALRVQLDALAGNPSLLSDDEVRQLCDQVAIRSGGNGWRCVQKELGAVAEKMFASREWVVRGHIEKRLAEHKSLGYFVYGHTHHIERPWTVVAEGVVTVPVTVANSGAFQRLVDEPGFKVRVAARGMSTAEGLKKLRPEDLPPCYGAVIVTYRNDVPSMATRFWWMEEGGKGALVTLDDARCQ